MDVAGPKRNGPGDDLVHQPNDGRVHAGVGGVDFAQFVARGLGFVQVLLFDGLLDRFLDGFTGAVVQLDRIKNVAFRSADDFHRQTGQLLQRVDGHHIARVRQRHRQGAVFLRQRQRLQTFGGLEGHQLENRLVDHAAVHVHHFRLGLLGDEIRDNLLRYEPEADQDLANEAAAAFLLAQRQVKLRLRKVTRLEEPFA